MKSVMTLVVVGVAAIGGLQVETQSIDARGTLQILAPITLDVSEQGKRIGTSEETRLSLSAGKHVLTLSNRDLGYTSTQTVQIESGEVTTLKLNPHGSAMLQAMPWAEVWMDGKKIGETPLVYQLPLGTHEVVFKHPRFGERRVTTTVRANATSSVSVEMGKPGAR
jgi:hypothetical protein